MRLMTGLIDSARHVIGRRFTQETRVQNAVDDVASTIHQALVGGGAEHAVAARGVQPAAQGRVVQVDPIKPTLKAPAIKRLKLK